MSGWIAFAYSWTVFLAFIWGTESWPSRGERWTLLVFLTWPIGVPVLLIAGAFTKHGWRAQRRNRHKFTPTETKEQK